MFRLVLKGGGDASIPKAMMSKLGLFKRSPKLLNGEKYTIKSDVSHVPGDGVLIFANLTLWFLRMRLFSSCVAFTQPSCLMVTLS